MNEPITITQMMLIISSLIATRHSHRKNRKKSAVETSGGILSGVPFSSRGQGR